MNSTGSRPIATIRSARSSVSASMVAPVMKPAALAALSRTIPFALYVVRIGQLSWRRARRTDSAARRAPTPTATTGLSALSTRSSAGPASARSDGSVGGRLSAGPASLSTLTCTGPAGGAQAMRTAASTAALAVCGVADTDHFATASKSAGWSSRCRDTRLDSSVGTASVTTSIGTRSSSAWATPLTALAAPGPRVTTQAPGKPVSSPYVAAMIAAAVSA